MDALEEMDERRGENEGAAGEESVERQEREQQAQGVGEASSSVSGQALGPLELKVSLSGTLVAVSSLLQPGEGPTHAQVEGAKTGCKGSSSDCTG